LSRAGLLQKVKAEMKRKHATSTFDILFVVDCKRSWYTHEDDVELTNDAKSPQQIQSSSSPASGYVSGIGSYYRRELEVALRPYKQVIMLGDSMGASAALMFSPLATAVIAFCPQVHFHHDTLSLSCNQLREKVLPVFHYCDRTLICFFRI